MGQVARLETLPQIRKAVNEFSAKLDDEEKERSEGLVAVNNRIAIEEITRNNQITNLTTLVGANSLEIAKHTTSIKSATKKVKSIVAGTIPLDGLMLKDEEGGTWAVRINREKKCLEVVYLDDDSEVLEEKPLEKEKNE